jgi:hypothetical protein
VWGAIILSARKWDPRVGRHAGVLFSFVRKQRVSFTPYSVLLVEHRLANQSEPRWCVVLCMWNCLHAAMSGGWTCVPDHGKISYFRSRI